MYDPIVSFIGDYARLNPAYLEDVVYDGDTYPSIIAAVEASKFPKGRRDVFINGTSRAALIGAAVDYEDKQLEVLEQLLRERFKPGTEFHKVLMSTGVRTIVYTNDMHRNWYGACSCAVCAEVAHQNHVGKILEAIRAGR